MCGSNVKELFNKTPRYFELLTVQVSGTKLDIIVLELTLLLRFFGLIKIIFDLDKFSVNLFRVSYHPFSISVVNHFRFQWLKTSVISKQSWDERDTVVNIINIIQ